jgi:hypothetical protein
MWRPYIDEYVCYYVAYNLFKIQEKDLQSAESKNVSQKNQKT